MSAGESFEPGKIDVVEVPRNDLLEFVAYEEIGVAMANVSAVVGYDRDTFWRDILREEPVE